MKPRTTLRRIGMALGAITALGAWGGAQGSRRVKSDVPAAAGVPEGAGKSDRELACTWTNTMQDRRIYWSCESTQPYHVRRVWTGSEKTRRIRLSWPPFDSPYVGDYQVHLSCRTLQRGDYCSDFSDKTLTVEKDRTYLDIDVSAGEWSWNVINTLAQPGSHDNGFRVYSSGSSIQPQKGLIQVSSYCEQHPTSSTWFYVWHEGAISESGCYLPVFPGGDPNPKYIAAEIPMRGDYCTPGEKPMWATQGVHGLYQPRHLWIRVSEQVPRNARLHAVIVGGDVCTDCEHHVPSMQLLFDSVVEPGEVVKIPYARICEHPGDVEVRMNLTKGSRVIHETTLALSNGGGA